MAFEGSIQMIFFSMSTRTIGSQGGSNKMAAANFLWLHFLNNRSSFFFRSVVKRHSVGFHSLSVNMATDISSQLHDVTDSCVSYQIACMQNGATKMIFLRQ